jgi:hypothetical protein
MPNVAEDEGFRGWGVRFGVCGRDNLIGGKSKRGLRG